MKIKVIATGSKGNCTYIEVDEQTKLLVDVGIPMPKIEKGIDFQLSKINAILITHHHSDHALSVAKMLNACKPCYMPCYTAKKLNVLNDYHCHYVETNNVFEVNTAQIIPFLLPHTNSDGSVCENYGYLIKSALTNEVLFYATDFMYIPQTFMPCDYYCIESNYDADLPYFHNDISAVEKRRYESHASIQTIAKFLKSQDLSKMKELHLLHISNEMGDKQSMLNYLKEQGVIK